MSSCPAEGDLAWYLVHTKPKAEIVARDNLARQDFRVWLPWLRERKRHRGRYRTVISALFPRYLFIHLAAGLEDWSPIRSTIGVSALVRFGTWPARVPDGLVEALMTQADALDVCEFSAGPIEEGVRVRVVEGVMAGYEGICEACTSHERVSVLLDLAGRHTSLTLPERLVERV